MKNTISKEVLREYVKENEVVFQTSGNLVEVANDVEKEKKEELLAYFNDALGVEVYPKGYCSIKTEYADLDEWATEDDVFFLLQNTGVLICVSKQNAIENKLIEA